MNLLYKTTRLVSEVIYIKSSAYIYSTIHANFNLNSSQKYRQIEIELIVSVNTNKYNVQIPECRKVLFALSLNPR